MGKKIDGYAVKQFFKAVLLCLVAVSIPGLLLLNGIQSKKYKEQLAAIKELEEKQVKLVEENKKLITEISVLSSSDRIEDIAKNELGMTQAKSDEIIRVEITKNKK